MVNVVATALAKRADRRRLSVRGAVSHLVNDIWAFLATAVAGVVIIVTGWTRADAIASLVIAALMAYTGVGLVRAAGRVFLEAAPAGLDPDALGAELAASRRSGSGARSARLAAGSGRGCALGARVRRGDRDCHEVAATLRQTAGRRARTAARDAAGRPCRVNPTDESLMEHCDEPHGRVHTAAGLSRELDSGVEQR